MDIVEGKQARTGLGGAVGFGETLIPRGDDVSFQADLSAVFESGLKFAGRQFAADAVYVNTNGLISFGAPFSDYPTQENHVLGLPYIAPFWGDVDTRLDGEGSESGGIWLDIDPASDVVTVTWDHVGVYRRNAEVTNTIQLQLVDRGGGDFDIVFRYQEVGWKQGTAPGDIGAKAGVVVGDTPYWLLQDSPEVDVFGLPDVIGNTGTAGFWVFKVRDGVVVDGDDTPTDPPLIPGVTLHGGPGADRLIGGAGDDTIWGRGGDDRIEGGDGNDTIHAGDGTDTILGGAGDDFIYCGDSTADLRDIALGLDGNDWIEGGYGNDLLRGGEGDDMVLGGFGVDIVIGGPGNDVLTGSAYSDLIFGNDGDDFVNGGFGHDRVNGGPGADRFYHLGIFDHGSDWIQDYRHGEGDVLLFANRDALPEQFKVNYANTPNAGLAAVAEAFIIYLPTNQIMWALVDGGAQPQITVEIAGTYYDLLV